jgi:hypothetical protein
MINPIELQLEPPQPIPAPPVMPDRARTQITAEQLQALIALLASANPALIVLPEGKQFIDVKRFNVQVLPNGKGSVTVVF